MKKLKRNCGGGAGLGLTKLLALFVVIAMAVGIMPAVALAEPTDGKIDLGEPLVLYNFPSSANIGYMTDGNDDTTFSFARSALNGDSQKSWISVVVYDAEDGKTFDFNTVTAKNGQIVHYYATNSLTNGAYSLNDIDSGWSNDESLTDGEKDCSDTDDGTNKNRGTFAERFGLTHITDLESGTYESPSTLSYKYFVVIFGAGWTATTSTELTLSLGQRHFIDGLIGNAETIYDMSYIKKPAATNGDSHVRDYLGEGWTVKSNDEGTWDENGIKFLGGNLEDHSANVKAYGLQTGWGGDANSDPQDGGLMNVLQFWSGKASGEYYISAEKDVAESSEQKDYYVFEFYPSTDEVKDNYLSYGDIALFDDSHNLITSFRYGMADYAAISPYRSFGAEDAKYGGENAPYIYDLAGTDDNNESVQNGWRVRRSKKVRVVVTNDRASNSHTVKWYYMGGIDDPKGSNSGFKNKTDDWTYFFGATYKNTVDGLGKIEAYRISQNVSNQSWRHLGLGDLKVFGGNFSNEEETYNLPDSYRASLNTQPELPNTVEIDDTQYTVNWPYVDTTVAGDKTVTGVIIETGRKITAKVKVGDMNDYLTHYYDFNGDVKNKGNTGAAGDGQLMGDAKIYENKLLINRNDNSRTDYMKIGDAVVADDQTEVTITAFFRPSINQQENPLFGFGVGDNKRAFYNPNTNNGQFFEVRANDGWNVSDYSGFNFSSSALADKWHHIAIVVKGNHVTTYYNGEHVGEHTYGLNDTVINCMKGTENYIGTSGYSSGIPWSFTGFIDDFRIYNIALHADEVAELANARPAEDNDLIAVSAPELNVVGKDSDEYTDDLYMEYKVDFSDVKESVSEHCANRTLHYYVTVNQYDTDSNTFTPVETEQEITELDESGIATVGVLPENPNVIYGVSASAKVDNDAYEAVAADIANATTLYEEVLKDLADGGYKETDTLDTARLANANAVIGRGGLAAISDLPEIQSKIMKAEGNTVTVIDPFKTLGIGFMYNENQLYIGSVAATGGENGRVYRSLTLQDGAVTLGDPVDVTGQEAVTLSLDAVQIEYVETLIESLETEDTGSEADFIPEL